MMKSAAALARFMSRSDPAYIAVSRLVALTPVDHTLNGFFLDATGRKNEVRVWLLSMPLYSYFHDITFDYSRELDWSISIEEPDIMARANSWLNSADNIEFLLHGQRLEGMLERILAHKPVDSFFRLVNAGSTCLLLDRAACAKSYYEQALARRVWPHEQDVRETLGRVIRALPHDPSVGLAVLDGWERTARKNILKKHA